MFVSKSVVHALQSGVKNIKKSEQKMPKLVYRFMHKTVYFQFSITVQWYHQIEIDNF